MNQGQFNRIIKVVKRTGDKFIISEGEDMVVLMDFDAYEHIVDSNTISELQGLSEEELMDKINNDIATWRAFNEKKDEHLAYSDMALQNKPLTKSTEYNEEMKEISPMNEEKTVENLQEEALNDVKEEEEEKFYLEPIE